MADVDPATFTENVTVATPPQDKAVEAVAELRATAEAREVIEVARHAGDRVFDVVKTHACTMPTVSAAIGMGMLVAKQIVEETIAFAVNSMDGDAQDETMVREAANALAREIVVPAIAASSTADAERHGFDPRIHVPGFWRCAKCGFMLVQSNLNATDGTVTPRDDAGDRCPNDDAPLWRVTWQEHANEMGERCEALVTADAERIKVLELDRDRLDFIERGCLDLRSTTLSTGAGDADVGYQVIGHFMAKPQERVMAEVYDQDVRGAIDAAMNAALTKATQDSE